LDIQQRTLLSFIHTYAMAQNGGKLTGWIFKNWDCLRLACPEVGDT